MRDSLEAPWIQIVCRRPEAKTPKSGFRQQKRIGRSSNIIHALINHKYLMIFLKRLARLHEWLKAYHRKSCSTNINILRKVRWWLLKEPCLIWVHHTEFVILMLNPSGRYEYKEYNSFIDDMSVQNLQELKKEHRGRCHCIAEIFSVPVRRFKYSLYLYSGIM